MLDFDTEVKLYVYRVIAESGRAPTGTEVAQAFDRPVTEVEAAFQRLYQKRLLVLEPDNPSKIRMAPPFSNVKTSFQVQVGKKVYYANCVWDALGIPAALHEEAEVSASDAWTNEPIPLQVRSGHPVPQECVIHFAVPAAHWWDDIIYT